MTSPLDRRVRNRTVLQRQALLARVETTIPALLGRIGGIQAQYAPSMYVGLWSRLTGFRRADLDEALTARTVVQGTLMRATIHLVAADDWWPLSLAIGDQMRAWYLRTHRTHPETVVRRAAAEARQALADGPLTHAELATVVGRELVGTVHLFEDVVRVPPSGTWARRRADRYALAEQWIGAPPPIGVDAARARTVELYLSGFGPARPAEIALWSGLPRKAVDAALASLDVRWIGNGRDRFADLADAAPATGEEPAPVRLLPHWDATLLVHCREAEVIREDDRSQIFTSANPHSAATFLVDGTAAGTWRVADWSNADPVEIVPFRPLASGTSRAVRREVDAIRTSFADPA